MAISSEQIQKNVVKVTGRLLLALADDEGLCEHFADCLETFLDEVACDDGFGTERQCDPRGDFRNRDDWSIFGEIQ
jgi:hypothetical protein